MRDRSDQTRWWLEPMASSLETTTPTRCWLQPLIQRQTPSILAEGCKHGAKYAVLGRFTKDFFHEACAAKTHGDEKLGPRHQDSTRLWSHTRQSLSDWVYFLLMTKGGGGRNSTNGRIEAAGGRFLPLTSHQRGWHEPKRTLHFSFLLPLTFSSSAVRANFTPPSLPSAVTVSPPAVPFLPHTSSSSSSSAFFFL